MKTGFQNKKCGLIGEKLPHSFSPLIHKELADYSFVIRELSPNELENFVKSRELDAYCVTIPYKKAIIPLLDEISEEARNIGAVNTVVTAPDGKLYGYNTDYFGFEYMLDSVNIGVSGKKAIVFGNGGASATVCAVLRDRQVSELVVVGIDDNTPEKLAKHADARIIVNATPVGTYPNNEASPTDLSLFPNCELVLDLVYNPARTQLIMQAEQRKIASVSGLPMLVAQAAKGFEYFTGDSYEEGAVERITELISKNTQNIILIGMPGCGKSTLGRLLADKLDREFFDADDEFTASYDITPAEAIRTLGEKKFRDMEHEILLSLGKKSSTVIATGGGAVTREDNYAPLHQNGVIVFLVRDLNSLATDGRPLSQKNSLEELYEKRINAYRRFADMTFHITQKPSESVDSLLIAIERSGKEKI